MADQPDCEGCTAPCCRGFVVRTYGRINAAGVLMKTDTLRYVPPSDNVFQRSGIPVKVVKIKHGMADLNCEALVDNRCAVYDDRPELRKSYDCRDDQNRMAGKDEDRPHCELRHG